MALQNENWDEAEKYLLEALKVEPQNAEIMVQIGYHVHARKGQWKEMNEMFTSAVSINPEGKALGRPVKEITHFTGEWTLIFICLTLSMSPLKKFTKLFISQ